MDNKQINSVGFWVFLVVIVISFSFVFESVFSQVEVSFECDSGFIGVSIEDGDFENVSLNNIDNLKCSFFVKGSPFVLGVLG